MWLQHTFVDGGLQFYIATGGFSSHFIISLIGWVWVNWYGFICCTLSFTSFHSSTGETKNLLKFFFDDALGFQDCWYQVGRMSGEFKSVKIFSSAGKCRTLISVLFRRHSRNYKGSTHLISLTSWGWLIKTLEYGKITGIQKGIIEDTIKTLGFCRDGQENSNGKDGENTEAKVVNSEASDADLYDAVIEPSGQTVKTESSHKANITTSSPVQSTKSLPALGVSANSGGRRYCCYIGISFVYSSF